MAYALEIQDVHKVFNRGTINEKVALNGVNLNLNPGDFVTIIGGNGAGKSTTLNAIAGVWPIDSGEPARTQESKISGKSIPGSHDGNRSYHGYRREHGDCVTSR